MPTKEQMRAAIADPELRRAIQIMNDIYEAHEALATLSVPVIEVLCDTFREMAEERAGPRGALKRAWWKYTEQILKDVKTQRERGVLGLYDPEPH